MMSVEGDRCFAVALCSARGAQALGASTALGTRPVVAAMGG